MTNQRNFTFKQDYLTEETPTVDRPTAYAGLTVLASPPMASAQSLHYPGGKNSPLVPFFKRS